LSAFLLFDLIDACGFPPGVVNLISGPGRPIGEALAAHPAIDMISFTGSTAAGRRISELAAPTIKRVAMELGGKSASILLDDAELEAAVKGTVNSCFLNSGQTCSALTRMLVPETRYAAVVEQTIRVAQTFSVGDPFAGQAKLGPLVSEKQQRRVRDYIQCGIDEGAELLLGGPEIPEDLPCGYYVKPTVFGRVTPDMTIAREEIFGPVLSILSYRDEDEAVNIANDSPYGLSGAVWSRQRSRAERIARRLRTGQVDINGGRFNPLAPFGGYKQSGNGREMGSFGLEEFLELKSLQS
jgi:betaine-aldehyde dehydrogenase